MDAFKEPTDEELAAVEARFTFQPPRAEDNPRYDAVGAAIRDCAHVIMRNVPPGRERATALTALSDCRMHSNAGIALRGSKGA
jgi:hypothetical protein